MLNLILFISIQVFSAYLKAVLLNTLSSKNTFVYSKILKRSRCYIETYYLKQTEVRVYKYTFCLIFPPLVVLQFCSNKACIEQEGNCQIFYNSRAEMELFLIHHIFEMAGEKGNRALPSPEVSLNLKVKAT